MDKEWWHPLPDHELSDNYTSSTDKWLLDNLGDAGEKLDRLWKERCELKQQNQKLIEALEEIVNLNRTDPVPSDIAQQALDETNNLDN